MNYPIYDDFSLKQDTTDGNIGPLLTGQPWDVRGSYDGKTLPPTDHGQIRNGALVSDNMSTIYATQSPLFVPAHLGAMVSWLPGNGGTQAGSITLATCKDNRFVMQMGAHLTIMPNAWYFWVRDDNGFNAVATGKIDPVCQLDGTQYPVEYSIIGNNINISVCYKRYSYFNTRISPSMGPYCFWEVYYHDKTSTSAFSQINKIWAGPAVASCTEGILEVIC